MDRKTPIIDDIDDAEFRKTLLDRYKVENPQEVLNFIGNSSDLKNFLEGANSQIFAYFPEPTLYLDIFKDPTSESGTHLVLAIATTLEGEEALKKFHELIKNWFSKVTPRVNGRISLDLEFA